MLDIRYVREHQEEVAQAMKNRNASWDSALFNELDEARRAVIAEVEALQQERNSASKSIGKMMSEGKRDEAEAAKERVRAINDQISKLDARRDEVEGKLNDLIAHTPNLPNDKTPVGRSAAGAPRAISRRRASRPSRTGIWAPI